MKSFLPLEVPLPLSRPDKGGPAGGVLFDEPLPQSPPDKDGPVGDKDGPIGDKDGPIGGVLFDGTKLILLGAGALGLLGCCLLLFRRPQSHRTTTEPLPQTQAVPLAVGVILPKPLPKQTVLQGRCWVIDGDTIAIGKDRIRLAGIDAPELKDPWGEQSKWALFRLCKGQTVTARIKLPEVSYDRLVAECFLPDGRDLAAEQVRSGLALDCPAFSGDKYRHLEPEGARRKLWRVEARQRGLLPMDD